MQIYAMSGPQLHDFRDRPESLALWTRRPPQPLPTLPIEDYSEVFALPDLEAGLRVPEPIREDVLALARAFAQGFGPERVRVSLDIQRPCVRWHADNVVARLLCTYVGSGTLWLPEGAFNREAAERRGTTNEDILPDPSQARQLGLWEVGVLKGKRGNARPVYHRSPADAGDSLVLKVDFPD